jgi:two-component system chemotaxis response regulator CheB
MAIRVLVVDDSFVMRAILRGILATDPELVLVGEAANGIEALAAAERLQPQVVLLDIEMPEMDGIECLTKLRERSSVPVIIVSSLAREGAPEALEAIRRGAFRALQKPAGAQSLDLDETQGREIIEAIHEAVHRV